MLCGVFIIAVISLGYYSWPAILGASLIGLIFAWRVSIYLSRYLKRKERRERLMTDLARENDNSDQYSR